jgi:hypothetical protein
LRIIVGGTKCNALTSKLIFFFDFYVLVKFAVWWGFLSTLLQAIVGSGGAYQDAALGADGAIALARNTKLHWTKETEVFLATEEILRLCVNKPCSLLAIGYTCIS